MFVEIIIDIKWNLNVGILILIKFLLIKVKQERGLDTEYSHTIGLYSEKKMP